MNNGNKPANPYFDADYDGDGNLDEYQKHLGLNKREHFAALAMQGILSRVDTCDAYEIASASVMYAEALLKALNTEVVK